MSKSVICLGGRVSLLAPFLPRVVTIRPAFESFERDFLTKVVSALTLSASIAEGSSSPSRKPRAAMMCVATVNWTLVADITSPTEYVMLTSTIRIQVFFTPWGSGRGFQTRFMAYVSGRDQRLFFSITFVKPATIRIRDFHCYGY